MTHFFVQGIIMWNSSTKAFKVDHDWYHFQLKLKQTFSLSLWVLCCIRWALQRSLSCS